MTIKEFSRNFFIQELCPICIRKQSRNLSFSKSTLRKYRCTLKLVHQVFGQDTIESLTTGELENRLYEFHFESGYSRSVINTMIDALRHIYKEAQIEELVSWNPALKIQKLKTNPRPKTFMTKQELKDFFNPNIWDDKRFYTGFKIARYTGMRISEIRVLNSSDLFLKDDFYYILVQKTHNWIDGVKLPKSHNKRIVPLPYWLGKELNLQNKNRNFWFSDDLDDKPISTWRFHYQFVKKLEIIGISDEERKKRNLTVHSFRHRYISLLTGNVPYEQLCLIVGHKSQNTTKSYTHGMLNDFDSVLQHDFYRDPYDC